MSYEEVGAKQVRFIKDPRLYLPIKFPTLDELERKLARPGYCVRIVALDPLTAPIAIPPFTILRCATITVDVRAKHR
jgi:hypothetical protein